MTGIIIKLEDYRKEAPIITIKTQSEAQILAMPLKDEHELCHGIGANIGASNALDKVCKWLHENTIREFGGRVFIEEIERTLKPIRIAVDSSLKEQA